jgi:hypothetical protein
MPQEALVQGALRSRRRISPGCFLSRFSLKSTGKQTHQYGCGKGGGGRVQHQDQQGQYCPRCYEYSTSGNDKEIVCAQCEYRGAPLPYTPEQIEGARAWAEELGKHFGRE